MPRRLAAVLAASLLTVALAAPASAQSGTCTVNPDPAPVGSAYTVSVAGLEPGVTEVLSLRQAGQPTAFAGLDTLLLVGPDGTGSWAQGVPWGPQGIWVPGEVSVRVATQREGYQTTGLDAACSFAVV